MPELDTITVKGFKSIASIEDLKLGAINIVIGANGSGKSNFIGVFSFLHAIREGRLQDYVRQARGADKVLHFGAKVTETIQLRLKLGSGANTYSLDLSASSGDELYPRAESIGFCQSPDQVLHPNGKEAGISVEVKYGRPFYVRDQMTRWRVYHFHDTGPNSPMKKTVEINNNHYFRPDGSNLAAFLFFLREKHPTSYTLIRRTVQRVAPFFDDFQLEPLRLDEQTIQLEWRHAGSDSYFDASSLSDGTLRFIALATLFLQPEDHRPSVILVDEPELGLHPYAMTLLASLVKQASVKTQVILSTQSPLLLDHFQPEDVLVADRVDGSTRLSRLDSAALATWLEDYSLGQLWEKNELGGRPTGE